MTPVQPLEAPVYKPWAVMARDVFTFAVMACDVFTFRMACDVFTFRPTPPKNTSETSLDFLDMSSDINGSYIGNGKFEYISNRNDREMFINAWQAISQTNLWDFVRSHIQPFALSTDQRVEVIGEKMIELGYDRHSGSSFGSTLRHMQHLAIHGEKTFKELYNMK
jgi:hypothetical protein